MLRCAAVCNMLAQFYATSPHNKTGRYAAWWVLPFNGERLNMENFSDIFMFVCHCDRVHPSTRDKNTNPYICLFFLDGYFTPPCHVIKRLSSISYYAY